jgi:hypothetical protein
VLLALGAFAAWRPLQARALEGQRTVRFLAGELAGAEALIAARPDLLWPALHGAFRRGDYESGRRLAALAPTDPRAALYDAAALLELGRDGEARPAAEKIPPSFRTGGLGREVERVLELRARGAVTLVRDRHGALLGSIDSAGALLPFSPDESPLLPQGAWREPAVPSGGAGLRLSVDGALARVALAALGAHRGTIVLVDPHTGAVLAAVSDARTRAEEPGAAFQQRREPASISKIITATAALRSGLDPDAEISRMTCEGHARYGSGSLWCSAPGGRLRGLGHALAISCNVAFANLGERLGRPKVVNELRRWGFDAPFEELPGAGRVTAPEGDARQLADLSVGLSATDITPVHGALMGAVLANEGRMPVPTLLFAEDSALGLSPRPLTPRPARAVLDPSWVPALAQALHAVTDVGGTAEGADPPDFQVAMKTGTAAEGKLGYHVNYIGAGPLPEPRVAFCVRVTHQPTSRHVNEAAREVLRALLNSLASRG